MTRPGVVLQLHIKTRRTAKTANCWRAAGNNSGFFNLIKFFRCTFDNGKRGAGFTVAFAPVFQADKHPRHVLAVAARARTDRGKHRRDVVFLMSEVILLDLFHHFQGLLLGRAAGQLRRGGEHATVLQWQERRWQTQEQKHHAAK